MLRNLQSLREVHIAARSRSTRKLCSFSEIRSSCDVVKLEDAEVDSSPGAVKTTINMAEAEEINVEVVERDSIDLERDSIDLDEKNKVTIPDESVVKTGQVDDNEGDLDACLYLEDLDNIDIKILQFDGLEPLNPDVPALEEKTEEAVVPTKVTTTVTKGVSVDKVNPVIDIVNAGAVVADEKGKKLGRGFRDEPDAGLVAASKGKEKQRSEHNDRWSIRRADQLRMHLGWDMSIKLGDLPFSDLDELLSNLFTRVTKVNGEDYPSESLINLLGGFNRVVRRASEIRALEGRGNVLESNFNIRNHIAFPKTRLTLTAAIRKSAREGKNKKREKVETFTIAMEMAILSDLDHQITNSVGCQKRLAFYIMCRLGVRGGMELWLMMKVDLKLKVDKTGKEFIE